MNHLQPTSKDNASYLPVGEQIPFSLKASDDRRDQSTTIPYFTQRSSGKDFQTRNSLKGSIYTKEPESIKEKKSSGIKTAFSGLISTIERFTLTTQRPHQPNIPLQTPQQKTIQPESRKSFREQTPQSPRQSRNLKLRPTHPVGQEPRPADQRPQQDHHPCKQVRFLEQPSPPRPRNQQVRFLLRPCLKERHPQYPDSPAVHFRPQDPLLPHFQRHHLHLQDLIHLTHRQQWPNRINPHDPSARPPNPHTRTPTRLPPFGTRWPATMT